MKQRSLKAGLVLIFCLLGTMAFAKQEPTKKAVSSRNAVIKVKQPPAIPRPVAPTQPSTPTRSEVKKPTPLFSLNPPVKTLNQRFQVLAGKKEPGASVYLNGRQVIPANPYSSWYYEYPYSAQANPRLSLGIALAPGKAISLLSVDLNSVLSLPAEAPRISAISLDHPSRDIILTIQDPPGVLSYNIYYANSLDSIGSFSPFILAQQDFPVSGTGTTTWRDNGSFTQTHPKNVVMRFYKLEIAKTESQPLQIINITPPTNSTFLAGAEVDIRIYVYSFNSDKLQYQFSIGGIVKQTRVGGAIFHWLTSTDDVGTANVTCEVRDTKGNFVSRALTYNIINPTAEEILQKVADNYGKFYDKKMDVTLVSKFKHEPFGETVYTRHYFKKPDKQRTEIFSNQDRIGSNKNEIQIINGPDVYSRDPQNKIKSHTNVLTEANITQEQLNQMDEIYHLDNFLKGHTVLKKINPDDLAEGLLIIEAVPKTDNKFYSRMGIQIDYFKGLKTKFLT